MEGRLVVGEREVQIAVLQPPVVVFAVYQIMALVAVLVRGQVQEVADAVGFFADVVAGDGQSGGGWRTASKRWNTHSSLRSDSKCWRAKLTGWAPGKPYEFRPRSLATSERSSLSRSPVAFTPGCAMSRSGCAPWSIVMADLARCLNGKVAPN